ncbi:MAG: hypothetical protein AAGF91_03900 [Actinomycetota bacterium]
MTAIDALMPNAPSEATSEPTAAEDGGRGFADTFRRAQLDDAARQPRRRDRFESPTPEPGSRDPELRDRDLIGRQGRHSVRDDVSAADASSARRPDDSAATDRSEPARLGVEASRAVGAASTTATTSDQHDASSATEAVPSSDESPVGVATPIAPAHLSAMPAAMSTTLPASIAAPSTIPGGADPTTPLTGATTDPSALAATIAVPDSVPPNSTPAPAIEPAMDPTVPTSVGVARPVAGIDPPRTDLADEIAGSSPMSSVSATTTAAAPTAATATAGLVDGSPSGAVDAGRPSVSGPAADHTSITTSDPSLADGSGDRATAIEEFSVETLAGRTSASSPGTDAGRPADSPRSDAAARLAGDAPRTISVAAPATSPADASPDVATEPVATDVDTPPVPVETIRRDPAGSTSSTSAAAPADAVEVGGELVDAGGASDVRPAETGDVRQPARAAEMASRIIDQLARREAYENAERTRSLSGDRLELEIATERFGVVRVEASEGSDGLHLSLRSDGRADARSLIDLAAQLRDQFDRDGVDLAGLDVGADREGTDTEPADRDPSSVDRRDRRSAVTDQPDAVVGALAADSSSGLDLRL